MSVSFGKKIINKETKKRKANRKEKKSEEHR